MSELYPEAIYGTRNGGTMTPKQRDGFGGIARRYAYNLGYADGWVDRGKSVMPVPAGWSNLTAAIKAGERIDWDALDGLEAKCVHPELGTLTYLLERDSICSSTIPSGWYMNKSANVWKQAVSDSWYGLQGWSLWVKGDLPLRKLTADQLEPGTCFRGHHYTHSHDDGEYMTVVVTDKGKFVSYLVTADLTPAIEVEVLEVYGVGTFQTPKENQ